MSGRLTVVVPVLDEAENLERLVASFREVARDLASHRPRFVLVDDGSRDGTADLARSLAAGLDFTVLRHEVNRGPGHAFGTAFESLARDLEDDDFVATMEGDNTSRHELLRQLLTRTQEGFEVVLASPYMYGGGIANTSFLRTFMSHCANAFVKEALGIRGILTVSSFYRVYRGSVLRRLQARYGPRVIERRGFESMIEVIMKLVALEATISEVAMKLDTSRRKGKSKMKVLRTIAGYLTLWKDRRRWERAARA